MPPVYALLLRILETV